MADRPHLPSRRYLAGIVGWRRYGSRVSTIADNRASAAAGPVAAHHPVGVSTGVFDASRCRWPELVSAACGVSTYAVELSALSAGEMPGLVAYLREKPRLPFRYVSVHAPVKNLDRGDAATVALLARLPLWVRSIVTHPDALSDVDAYGGLGTRLVLENMDDRKRTGRTTDEMATFFNALPDAGFCLDVAHARSIDPAMEVAHEMLDRFRSQLRQVHLSSLSDGHHVPLTADDEDLFAAVLGRCRDVPWILEARPPERWADELAATPFVSGRSSLAADRM